MAGLNEKAWRAVRGREIAMVFQEPIIVEEGPAADVLRAPRHPYTQGLLAASPSLQKRKLTPTGHGAAAHRAASGLRL